MQRKQQQALRSPRRQSVVAFASKHKAIAQNAPRSARVVIDYDRVYSDPSYQLSSRQLGNVVMQTIPGKGRGVLAKSDMAIGEDVMVSMPIVLASAAPGTSISPEALVSKLKGRELSLGDRYAHGHSTHICEVAWISRDANAC